MRGYEDEVLERSFRIPHDSPPRWLLVLTLYADESGQHQDKDRMFVAGYMGSDDQWRDFPEKWARAIHPWPHLHLCKLKFKPGTTRLKTMLARAALVPSSCGLTPVLGGIRQKDYRDLVFGAAEEYVMCGYAMCVHAMVYNALRYIPKNERLEVVLERQETYGRTAEIAMQSIQDLEDSDLLTEEGKTKLASWRFVPKESTVLTEPGDFLANALFNVWKDENSLRSKWCRPLLEVDNDRTVGKIWSRDEMREIIQAHPISDFLDPEVRAITEAARATMGSDEFGLFREYLKAILQGDQKTLDKLKEGTRKR